MRTGSAARGVFVLSLDFELYWGVRDYVRFAHYRDNLAGVRQVVPRLLDLFGRHELHATWATVGLLFFDTKEELLRHLPEKRPSYRDARLSPYGDLAGLGDDERSDIYRFAPSLVRQIAAAPHQELATHTFSHYLCLAPGQTVDEFRHDLAAAVRVAEEKTGRRPVSIVFPKNQVSAPHVAVCKELGFVAYRGTERSWLHRPGGTRNAIRAKRLLRLVDAYVDLSGDHAHSLDASEGIPVDVPASRFLRPYSPALRMLEPLRLRRITRSMTAAARSGRVFHLWWHPHNFGVHQRENFLFLERILSRFSELRRELGMRSQSMGEVAREHLAGAAGSLRHARPAAAVGPDRSHA